MSCPTTARGLGCCFQTPCSISIAKTQQIIPCLPHFLLLNEHSSRPNELSNLASAMLNSKIRPRAVVGYGVKMFHPSPPNYVTRSPRNVSKNNTFYEGTLDYLKCLFDSPVISNVLP